MSNEEAHVRQVGLRLTQATYDKLVEKQQEAKRTTGFEPTISDVIRQLIERGLKSNGKRR